MARKATRLQFTENDLRNSTVKKSVDKATKVADKADKASAKVPKRTKLRNTAEGPSAIGGKTKLRFIKEEIPIGELKGRRNRFTGSTIASANIHNQISSQNEDDNSAVHAVDTTTGAIDTGTSVVGHAIYSKKLKAYENAEKLQKKSDVANVEAIYQKRKTESPDDFSNPLSRMQQKKMIRNEYVAAKRAESTASTGTKTTGNIIRGVKNKLVVFKDNVVHCVSKNPGTVLAIGGILLLLLILSSGLSSCSVLLPSGEGTLIITSYTADDDVIIRVNDDYKNMEQALQDEIDNIERNHPSYDEYNYDLDEIGHDPYQLASYLTVQFEDYSRNEVQGTLQRLFDKQYQLTLEEVVETRYRTETRTGHYTVVDPETGESHRESYTYEVEVPYDYYILNVTLRNKDLGNVITEYGGMDDDQAERYAILLQTKGNKAELFADDPYVSTGEYLDYDIPGEALTDVKFARMIQEAEKYLGYPYVWGGSSPSTSFDCSGFVSWVINHCGNGWSYGRLTANGLKNVCSIIPASSAKPGDLIFFKGTYNTSGASHVGIYVGNGMMIHCGNPISYASINTSYWQQHFYCFGRLPN